MYSCETMSKGACIKRMVAVRNYDTNTGKKTNKGKGGGGGGGLRIQNLVLMLIPLGHFELHFWLCQPQTRKTTV